METTNGIVSTALLSLLFEKKRKDNLDLIRPFVECALCVKCSLGDKIDLSIISSYMESEFGFEKIVDSVIVIILERLIKDKHVSRKYSSYYYIKALDDKRNAFENQREHARQLLAKITDHVRTVFEESGLNKLQDEEIHSIIYEYFEKYGLSIFNKTSAIVSSRNTNPYIYTLATYIIEKEKDNSSEFNDIVQLYKGVLLSSAIYIQTNNTDLYYARFKNTTIYFDAPVMLRILGLCSNNDNRREMQLYELLKGKVSLKLFEHSFNELCSIILAYKKNLGKNYRRNNTLKFFDQNKFSATEITNYYISLPQTLTKLDIGIDDNQGVSIDRTSIEYNELRNSLRNAISFYDTHEPALEYDTDSVYLTNCLRGNKAVTAIENCQAIFVTMNKALAHTAFEWQNNELSSVPLVISDTDLSVIMWLKEYKSKKNFPKDFIVANAFGTLESISDSFVEQLSEKVKLMQENNLIAQTDVALVLENIYIQKKLFEDSKGDIESITEAEIVEVRDQYKAQYAKELGIDNAKLAQEVDESKHIIEELTTQKDRNRSATMLLIQKQAQSHAKSSTRWIPILSWSVILLCLAACIALTVINIAFSTNAILLVFNIVSGLFFILGIVDHRIRVFNFIKKLRQRAFSIKYTKKYTELLKQYEDAAEGAN